MNILYIFGAVCILGIAGKILSNLTNRSKEEVKIESKSEIEKALEKYKYLDD